METDTSSWINRKNLVWARKRVGLSVKDVGVLSADLGKFYVRIDPARLQEWESGDAVPELGDLEALSSIYVCPVGYFFLPATPKDPPPLSFRGLSPDYEQRLTPHSRQTLLRFVELAGCAVHMVNEAGVNWEVSLEYGDRPVDTTKSDEIVKRERSRLGFSPDLRKKWKTKSDALNWWRRSIEGQGVFCFQMKLNPQEIRGASTWIDKTYPFILMNQQDSEATAGRLFTLLHEYAHLLLRSEGVVCDFGGTSRGSENPEPFANRFAAHMLLTQDEFTEQLRDLGLSQPRERWSDDDLDRIRTPFFVSRHVIAVMLEQNGLAPPDFFHLKRQQWSIRKPGGRRGRRPTLNEAALNRVGFSLANVILRVARRGTLPITDLSYALDLRFDKARDFLRWAHETVSGQ
jgi:Zn-dependent peptidase ImmA (M78 family)